ncbi:MAG: class I SAM-dependent methyltransferase [Wenzhouxiangella sp.]|nr:MAG: class I SAM-dependent methyltransferase [Wenzhouxiangella sp.]
MRGLEQIPWLYDGLMRLAPGIARWRADLVAEARGRVLEVGCGTGLALAAYAERVEFAVGVDPARQSLRRAQRRAHAPVICASAHHLPFADASFDTVVSSLVFCSVPDPMAGLAEIRRVLRPDGQLLMLEHVQSTSRFAAFVLDKLQPAWTRISGGCHPNRHTEQLVEEAGFRIQQRPYRARGVMRLFVARP